MACPRSGTDDQPNRRHRPRRTLLGARICLLKGIVMGCMNMTGRAGLPVDDLVTRARKGDKQAWDALIERYAPLIWSICHGHRGRAEPQGGMVGINAGLGQLTAALVAESVACPSRSSGYLSPAVEVLCRLPAEGMVDADLCAVRAPEHNADTCFAQSGISTTGGTFPAPRKAGDYVNVRVYLLVVLDHWCAVRGERGQAEVLQGDIGAVPEQAVLSFAGLLRRLRAKAGLTQEELAEAAGLSPRTVSDLERGINRTARKETAILLADALTLAGPARRSFVAAARGWASAAGVLLAIGDAPGSVDGSGSREPAGAGRRTGGCRRCWRVYRPGV
jgi:DNA-binding XRE family transcriptional regulator